MCGRSDGSIWRCCEILTVLKTKRNSYISLLDRNQNSAPYSAGGWYHLLSPQKQRQSYDKPLNTKIICYSLMTRGRTVILLILDQRKSRRFAPHSSICLGIYSRYTALGFGTYRSEEQIVYI